MLMLMLMMLMGALFCMMETRGGALLLRLGAILDSLKASAVEGQCGGEAAFC